MKPSPRRRSGRLPLWGARLLLVLAPLALAVRAAPPSPHALPASREAHPSAAVADTIFIDYRITSGNALGLTVYNTGAVGNNLQSRNPSLEYPLGTEQEHLVRGGLWVGGLFSEDGSFSQAETLVTHAATDGYMGSDHQSEFIPDPVTGAFLQRSILPNDRYYDPVHAKSEQDLICEYMDTYTVSGESDHRPLHVRVRQEILQFSFEPFDGIQLINYEIINDHPNSPIFDLYVGFYAELASGWKDGHDEWPPSGWFNRKDIAYVDSLRLISEHHYNLDDGDCPSWAGYLLLGTRPDTISTKTVSFNWWNWDPSGNLEDSPIIDRERYEKLSDGSIDATRGSEAPNNDPVTMLAVGPLGHDTFTDSSGVAHQILWAGDTVSVSFAVVGGIPSPEADPPRSAEEDIAFNAQWAQTAFDLNFNIPVPPPSPSLEIEAAHNRLTLWWDDLPLGFIDPKSHAQDFEGFRVYMSDVGKSESFRLIGEFDLVDTLFYNTDLTAISAAEPRLRIEDGDTLVFPYRFAIDDVRDGFKYWVAVTSFDTGSADIASLESGLPQNRTMTIPGALREEVPEQRVTVFPNPYHGDAAWDGTLTRDRYLWFAGLPPRCRIRIYNLAGDLVRTIDFDAAHYGATDVRGIYDPDDVRDPARDVPVLSGAMAAWDLTTSEDQAAASGLYVYSVENLETGAVERGKFLIMK